MAGTDIVLPDNAFAFHCLMILMILSFSSAPPNKLDVLLHHHPPTRLTPSSFHMQAKSPGSYSNHGWQTRFEPVSLALSSQFQHVDQPHHTRTVMPQLSLRYVGDPSPIMLISTAVRCVVRWTPFLRRAIAPGPESQQGNISPCHPRCASVHLSSYVCARMRRLVQSTPQQAE